MNTGELIKRLALSVLGFFIFLTSFCQKNYLPGYILQLNGDTLNGFVDYSKWERNTKAIYFKTESDEHTKKYTPNDIKGFRTKDEFYESAIIKTINSLASLDIDPGFEYEIDTVFLQTMFKGAKCLYYYQNKHGEDQFYIKSDSTYELLIYKQYFKVYNNQRAVLENKRYIGQLNNYLQDCGLIQSKLQKTECTKKSLRSLFASYYEFTKSDIQFQEKIKKISIETGILTGISLTSVKFVGSPEAYGPVVNPSPLIYTDFNKSVNFSAGLFCDIVLPKNQGKWSVNNELIYTSYKVTGLLDYFPADKYSINYSELGYSYLKINNMLRFKYPVGKLFLYINAGISNGFVVSEKNYLKIDRTYFSEHTIEEVRAINDSRKYEQGYLLGLGTRYKKFSFEIRNERGNGISKLTYITSPTNRYYFLLGYRF